METKADFRRYIRQEKKKYTQAELQARSEPIWRQVEQLPEFQQAATVAAYWSLPDEVDSHGFVEKWCGEKRMLLPVMLPDCALELREYRPDCRMNEAGFSIREPEGAAIDPSQVDLILIPGMAFDRHGHRLGRGKGYYDRLLCRMTAVKVGVCYEFQFLDAVPADPHDVAMDRVIYI